MMLRHAEGFVKNNSKHPWRVKGMQRQESSDYPYEAVREALVNAIIHRDYQNVGAEIHVDMFADRMEISSPGGMLDGRRIQDCNPYQVPSIRRNKLISDLFARLHYMDRRGSGFNRILSAYEGYESQPVLTSDTVQFLVTLPLRLSNEMAGNTSSFTSKNTGSEVTTTDLMDKSVVSTTNNRITEKDKSVFQARIKTHFRQRNADVLYRLFCKYEYKYPFNKQAIMAQSGITARAAEQLLSKCVDLEIMRHQRRDEYYFCHL